MNQQQARKLKVGDAVFWYGDPDDRGGVVTIGYSGFEIAWEKGQIYWVEYDDLEMLEMIERAAQP